MHRQEVAMTRKTTAWPVLIYGLLMISLGYMGYQAGSPMSLYMGSSFGTLLVLSSILMFFHFRFGGYAALLLIFGLTLSFTIRYSLTGKGRPAALALLSAGMLLFLLGRMVRWRR